MRSEHFPLSSLESLVRRVQPCAGIFNDGLHPEGHSANSSPGGCQSGGSDENERKCVS